MMTFFINLLFLATFLPIGITFFHIKLREPKIAFAFFILGVLLCTFVEIKITHLSPFLFPISFLCIALTLFAVFKAKLRILLLFELLSYFTIALLYQIIGIIYLQFPIKLNINDQSFTLVRSALIFILISLFSSIINSKAAF